MTIGQYGGRKEEIERVTPCASPSVHTVDFKGKKEKEDTKKGTSFRRWKKKERDEEKKAERQRMDGRKQEATKGTQD